MKNLSLPTFFLLLYWLKSKISLSELFHKRSMQHMDGLERQMPKDLIAIIIFVVISVVFIVVPPLNATPVRIIVGFPLVLFLPGYSLICVLFPKKNEMDGIERIALSIGLSIAVVIIIGLALNYTPWGIRLGPILLAISSLTLILTAVTATRKARSSTEEKPDW